MTKSIIREMKGGKYAKTLAKIQVSAIFATKARIHLLKKSLFSNTMTVQIGKMLQNKPLF